MNEKGASISRSARAGNDCVRTGDEGGSMASNKKPHMGEHGHDDSAVSRLHELHWTFDDRTELSSWTGY